MSFLSSSQGFQAWNTPEKYKVDLYRGINEFKRGYQPRNNLVKDENGDLLADSHNILNSWKSYFPQLLNVYNVRDVRQIEVHTAEPLLPGPSQLEVKIVIAKLKKYKSPDSEELHNLYSLPSIFRIIKSRRMRWVGYVGQMEEKRNAYRFLMGKPEGKRSLGRPRRRWVYNNRMYLGEVDSSCEFSIGPLGSMKYWETIKWPNI
jgi:hypothetical protein